MPLPSLQGAHQIVNAGTAIAAVYKILPQYGKTYSDIFAMGAVGLKNAYWPGRLEKITHGPIFAYAEQEIPNAELWVDGGHNEAAAAILADWVGQHPDMPTYFIIGLTGTKSAQAFMAALSPLLFQNSGKNAAHIHALAIPNVEHCLSAHLIASAARENGFCATPYNNSSAREFLMTLQKILRAIKAQTQAQAHSQCRILICGSLYLAGEVLRLSNG